MSYVQGFVYYTSHMLQNAFVIILKKNPYLTPIILSHMLYYEIVCLTDGQWQGGC
jgi:hypothetical protein